MFIVIEGIDGAGCETQAKLVYDKLKKQGAKTQLIKYPDYNNPVGKILQNFLYNNEKLDVNQQFLLYCLQFIWDSQKIVKSVRVSQSQPSESEGQLNQSKPIQPIKPNTDLTDSTTLIADRYFTTTLCYQTLEGIEENKALRFAQDFGIIKPDLVFFLDVKPDIAIRRKAGEDKVKNFREKDFEFIKKTYTKYQDLIKRQVWAKWLKVDGEREADVIAEEIISKLECDPKLRIHSNNPNYSGNSGVNL